MSSIYEEMSSEQKKRAKKIMSQLTQNPIAKSSGAGALSPEAAEQLGNKAKELRKKKLSQIELPSIKKEDYIAEREMSSSEMKKEKKLKSKYDKSAMKKSMIDQYGKERGTQIYFATIRKQAMEDSFELEGEQLDELAPLAAGMLAAGAAGLGAMAINRARQAAKSGVDAAKSGAKVKPSAGISGAAYGLQKRKQEMDAAMQQLRQSFDFDDAYDYIIEMLVAADYAEDYEAAKIMFEHISDEFTSVILEEYIEEKARGTRKKTTLHAYDVDETLFGHGKKGKPNVQVHVKDASGKRVKSLSNQEFNTHKLDKGHSYDFSEFQSAKKFSQTASPNKKVIKDIKRKQARGQNVHLITARSKFDNPSEFQGHLKKHGVDVDKKNIHYTGGMKGGDIGKKKVDVANAVAKQSGAKKTHMYDDAAKVHKAFEKEKEENPTSKTIKTHMVAPDKSGESRVRSFQATKGGTTGGPEKTTKQKQRARKKARRNMGEEMTAYEYWKQFINEDSEVISELSVAAQRELDALKRIPSNLAKNAVKKVKPNMLMRKELGNLGGAARNLGVRATPFLGVDTVLNTTAQEKGAADFQRRSGGVRPGELYRASDVNSKGVAKPGAKTQLGAIEAAARGKTATKDSKSALKPQTPIAPAKPLERKVISDKGGVNQKVSTNTAYKSKLGGREVTSTRGAGGEKMIRANLGNSGVNQVKAGKAKVGQSYGATLGGVKGNVKYDAKGNRTFQALQKPAAPAKPPNPAK